MRRVLLVVGPFLIAFGCTTFDGVSLPDATGETPDASAIDEADGSTPGAAGDASAIADAIGVGSGKDGPLEVAATLTPNLTAGLTGAAVAGATTLAVDDPSLFAPGDVVLIWQAAGLEVLPEEGAPTVLAEADGVGRYQLARVVSSGAGELLLGDALVASYSAVSQVVRVPQYTEVHVAIGGALVAPAWDGRKGGVLAFLASGRVNVEGALDASGKGFRGGAGSKAYHELEDCGGGDSEVKLGWALKGEGVGKGAPAGPRNVANGGGGGACHNAGGGGGGLGGTGGLGGRSANSDSGGRVAPSGLGGASVAFSPEQRLIMGGGGGAGEANDGQVASGGVGGGVVLVRALELAVSGELRADGTAGGPNNASGAGGGGAGGLIVVKATSALSCTQASAKGGAGGGVNGLICGPGGGGGGGVISLQGTPTSCPATVAHGAGGTVSGDPWGAKDGTDGTVR